MPEAPSAVRELAEDATSRKKFLRQAGGTGIAASLGAFIAACGGDSSMTSSQKPAATSTATAMMGGGTEQFGKGDLGIANYALTLEYLEADFYKQVIESGVITDKKLAAVAQQFGEGDLLHIARRPCSAGLERSARGLDDRREAVPMNETGVVAREVPVLVAIDVPDLGALPAIEGERIRRMVAGGAGVAARHHSLGALADRRRARCSPHVLGGDRVCQGLR